ncbi:MAG: hypothetical protein ABSB95_15125 [Dissulfurispiraceae bacterium]|jgi:hypothetical protein
MPDKEREKAFTEQSAQEIARNKDAITKIFERSRVGQCGGKCKWFKEDDLGNLCEQCLKALEEEADEIFSVSVEMGLFKDAMNNKCVHVDYSHGCKSDNSYYRNCLGCTLWNFIV